MLATRMPLQHVRPSAPASAGQNDMMANSTRQRAGQGGWGEGTMVVFIRRIAVAAMRTLSRRRPLGLPAAIGRSKAARKTARSVSGASRRKANRPYRSFMEF